MGPRRVYQDTVLCITECNPHLQIQIKLFCLDDMRERMVVWSEEGRPCGEIANLAGCSLRSVYKILEYDCEYGTERSNHKSKLVNMSVVVDLKLSE
jgi:hypothetical protein